MSTVVALRPDAQPLVHYDAMRRELALCVEIDEAAKLADKAAQIAAYARIRDDVEAEIQFSELKLNATQKIGELSLALDTERERDAKGRLLPSDGKQDKATVLADAGISTSTAHRAEELAGGINGHAAAMAATDKYFAQQRKAKQPPTMKGLRSVVRDAVQKSDPKPKAKAAQPPSPTYLAWLDFVSAIKIVAEHNAASLDAMAKQSRDGGALKDTLREARQAAKRLPRWITALEREGDQ